MHTKLWNQIILPWSADHELPQTLKILKYTSATHFGYRSMEVCHFVPKQVAEFAENILVPWIILQWHLGLHFPKFNSYRPKFVLRVRCVERLSRQSVKWWHFANNSYFIANHSHWSLLDFYPLQISVSSYHWKVSQLTTPDIRSGHYYFNNSD